MNLSDLAVWIIVGLLAGFLASRLVLGRPLGPALEFLVGVIGGIVGSLAFAFFHVTVRVAGYPILRQIIVAFPGAPVWCWPCGLIGDQLPGLAGATTPVVIIEPSP